MHHLQKYAIRHSDWWGFPIDSSTITRYHWPINKHVLTTKSPKPIPEREQAQGGDHLRPGTAGSLAIMIPAPLDPEKMAPTSTTDTIATPWQFATTCCGMPLVLSLTTFVRMSLACQIIPSIVVLAGGAVMVLVRCLMDRYFCWR